MPPRIFISYRRDDAAGDAGRLSDHLIRRFGAASVFLDIEAIAPGVDFVEALQASLQQTGVMLVIIGRRWVGAGGSGMRRLDDPADFVRREIETALARGTPILPVLVQGAPMPAAADLPASLAAFAQRQAVSVDHAEFRDDADRLCEHVARILGVATDIPVPFWRGHRLAMAGGALLALLFAGGVAYRAATDETTAPPDVDGARSPNTPAAASDSRVEVALAEADSQQRRNQYVEALATLAGARRLSPDADAVRRMQEDVAMDLIRNVRVPDGGTFGEAIKPGVAVVDAALPGTTGARRADLLAHSGWASFLMWRDGDRRLDPTEWYREALKIDPDNPYANAMLAHWMISRDDDVAGGTPLFLKAEGDLRARDAVRQLEWGAYNNVSGDAAAIERVRLADRMRRGGERLNDRQLSTLRNTYYQQSFAGREVMRDRLLEALPPDDHLATLAWAFGDVVAKAPEQGPLIKLYESLLHAEAGRTQQAIDGLVQLRKELTDSPGSLLDAVTSSLRALRSEPGEKPAPRRPRPRP
jgi:hypothetical protein